MVSTQIVNPVRRHDVSHTRVTGNANHRHHHHMFCSSCNNRCFFLFLFRNGYINETRERSSKATPCRSQAQQRQRLARYLASAAPARWSSHRPRAPHRGSFHLTGGGRPRDESSSPVRRSPPRDSAALGSYSWRAPWTPPSPPPLPPKLSSRTTSSQSPRFPPLFASFSPKRLLFCLCPRYTVEAG